VPTEQRRREAVAGLVIAYQEAAGVRQSQALRRVFDGLKTERKDFDITLEQARSWIKRVDGSGFKEHILERARKEYPRKPIADAVLAVGLFEVWELLSVPFIDQPSRR
jgi:hypothetical protein